MRSSRRTRCRIVLTAMAAVALIVATFTPPAMSEVRVRFQRLRGFKALGTPAELNKVGVLEIGRRGARNVLILVPGTSASAAYFAPLAKSIVAQAKRWQVWAVERRENLLEDHSVLDRAKEGTATGQELFDYYLGWLTDPDFNGTPGARHLSGLVFIDGGSNPIPVSPEQATTSLEGLRSASPWLTFGGIPAPFAGLFNATGSTGALIDPDAPSRGQRFALLPANLKPPIPVTNLAPLV
jgi:hypothetical protein